MKAALSYDAETHRVDPAHSARLATRERDLRIDIEDAYEAMRPGPVDQLELDMAKRFKSKPEKPEYG